MADEIRRETTSGPGNPPGGYSGSSYGGSYGGSAYGGGYGGGPAYGSVAATSVAYEKPPMLKRVSWGAIFAGTFVALALSVLLWLLGAAIGAATFDPAAPPGDAALWGFGIWGIVVTIIALFCGGIVAAWLAGLPKWMDAILHGVVVWGLTTTATIGFMVLTGATIFAGGMAAMGDQIAMGQQQQQQQQQQTFATMDPWADMDPRERVRNDLRSVLPTDDDWFGWNRDREYTDRDLDMLVRQIEQGQRQQVLGILVRDAEMDQRTAQNHIMQWERVLQQRGQRDDRLFATQERDMQRDTGPVVTPREASNAATAAFTWAFFALLLGACAAAVGGAIGRPAYMEERITQGGYPRYTPPGYQPHREGHGPSSHGGYSGHSGESGRYNPPPNY